MSLEDQPSLPYFLRVNFLSEKRKTLSKRQQEILSLLTFHDSLTTRKIMELLYPKEKIYIEGKVRRQSSKYVSVTRTLRSLQTKGLIKKAVSQTMWTKTK